ncbi:MAG: hypothetical protein IJW75_06350 [Alphaproteobacteria bacterium]|nr:hypothetical protein [Alphaproteobacteria bacterium]
MTAKCKTIQNVVKNQLGCLLYDYMQINNISLEELSAKTGILFSKVKHLQTGEICSFFDVYTIIKTLNLKIKVSLVDDDTIKKYPHIKCEGKY